MTRVTLWLGRALGMAAAIAGLSAAGALASEASTPQIVFSADRAPSLSGEIYGLRLSDGRRTDLSRSPYPDHEPLVSPDGTEVAFLSDRNGVEQALYVVGIDGRGLKRVTSLYPVRSFSWAPDGKRLLAVSRSWHSRTAPGVYVVQPGRRPRLVTRSPLGEAAWSPDGRLITVHTVRSRGHNFVQALSERGSAVWRIPAEGSVSWSAKGRLAVRTLDGIKIYSERRRRLSAFAGRTFAWSQSGERLAVVVGDRLELRTGDGRSVVLRTTVPGLARGEYNGIQWVSKSRIIVWGVSIGGGFVGFDIVKGKTWPVRYGDAYSSDGALVMHQARVAGSFALCVSDASGGGKRTITGVPGCFDDGSFRAAIGSVRFTPDARSLVYESDCREPFVNLYVVGSDGTGLRRLTRANEEEVDPQWSPDGRRIVYARSDYGELSCKGCPSTIWVRDSDGSHPRQITPARQDQWDSRPMWSPDGRKIAFSRGHLSSEGTFVIPADGGHARKVPRRPDWGAMWSRDGRQAALVDDERVVIEIAGRTTRDIRLPLAQARSLAWSPDGRQFVLTARANATAPFDVYTADVDGRHLRRLTRNLNATGADWRQ